jgi:interferon gamma-inducible protein 30
VLALYPDARQHMPFIYCMDSVFGDVETVARQCAQNTSIDFEKISNCTNSRQGNQLQHAYAVQTEHTKPTGAFVPWVTLNGNHTDEIQDKAETDLIRLLCETYKV